MRLQWLQVRRARQLPMPLPPKPKRPLGPPVLLHWNGVDIRTRADIEAAGHTWDEFHDSYAANDDPMYVGLLFQILQLVLDGERHALNREIRRRRLDYRERKAEEHRMRRFAEVVREPWFQRLLRRA